MDKPLEPEASVDARVSPVPVARSPTRQVVDALDGEPLARDEDDHTSAQPTEPAEQHSGIADAIRSLLRREKIR